MNAYYNPVRGFIIIYNEMLGQSGKARKIYIPYQSVHGGARKYNYTANIVSMEYYPVITLLGWIFPILKISKRCMISVELKGM